MKKIFFITAIAAAAVFGLMKATDVNVNNGLSDLQMENMELLAEGEPSHSDCYRVCNPAWDCHCDIAYWWNRAYFYRCEGFWPK